MRQYIKCVCGDTTFYSDIDVKKLKLRFSVLDKGDGTREITYPELIATPQGETVCRSCGRKIDIEAEEIVVSI